MATRVITLCLMTASCTMFNSVALAQEQSQPVIAAQGEETSTENAEAIDDTSSQVISTIQTARNAWLQGDAEAFANLFADSGEFLLPGDKFVGPEAIRDVVSGYLEDYTIANIEILNCVIQGDRAAVEWTWEAVEKSSGSESLALDAIFVELQDGKVLRWREYVDTDTPFPGQEGN